MSFLANKKICVLAHRGASFHAPENTAAAFEKAYDFHVDGIETDLHLTADEKVVVHHNYFINETSDGQGAIGRMTLEELKQFDFGAYRGEAFRGQRILTLEELFPLLEGMKVINLELKAPLDRKETFVAKVLEATERSNMADRVLFSSFDAGLLQRLKEEKKNCRVGLLTFREQMQPFLREMTAVFLSSCPVGNGMEMLERVGKRQSLVSLVESLSFPIDYLHPDYHSVLENPGLVEEMHRRKIGVNPYTCDGEEEMEQLVLTGCDGVITNRPDRAERICG